MNAYINFNFYIINLWLRGEPFLCMITVSSTCVNGISPPTSIYKWVSSNLTGNGLPAGHNDTQSHNEAGCPSPTKELALSSSSTPNQTQCNATTPLSLDHHWCTFPLYGCYILERFASTLFSCHLPPRSFLALQAPPPPSCLSSTLLRQFHLFFPSQGMR